MRIAIRFLGLDLFSVELSSDSPSPEPEYDADHDLSGGTTGIASEVFTGETDCFMGFTNGRGEDW